MGDDSGSTQFKPAPSRGRIVLVLGLVLGLALLLQGAVRRSIAIAAAATPSPAATSQPPAGKPVATLTPTNTPQPTRTLRPTYTLVPTRTTTPLPTLTATPLPATGPVTIEGRSLPGANPGPTVAPEERYRLGGIDFSDPDAPLSITYPADLQGTAVTRYEDLYILPVDLTGDNYRRFVTDYGGKVFVYIDTFSGSVVLSVHDGTLTGSGRVLEAEPLRRVIEGDLHVPYGLDVIEARMDQLTGREWVIGQGEHQARFRLVQGARLNAADVAFYRNRAAMLSTFLGGIPDPQRSILFFFCSGRQPGEPSVTFAGRYVLLLELID